MDLSENVKPLTMSWFFQPRQHSFELKHKPRATFLLTTATPNSTPGESQFSCLDSGRERLPIAAHPTSPSSITFGEARVFFHMWQGGYEDKVPKLEFTGEVGCRPERKDGQRRASNDGKLVHRVARPLLCRYREEDTLVDVPLRPREGRENQPQVQKL